MSQPTPLTPAASNAFMELIDVPPTGSGPLDGLRFAVKDVIDVAGYKSGCGNPTWRDTHPAAVVHAPCVALLPVAGGRAIGKTVSDQLAFSLLGENYHYGTPLNPKAADRVPGGSSSGSASAVACGFAEIALGTDTGGSVRVPASNCGIYGFRPSFGLISVAGVMALAPTFDTIGVFSADAAILARAASTLLSCDLPASEQAGTLHLLTDAFTQADADVQQALVEPVQALRGRLGSRVRETSLHDIVGGDGDFPTWFDTYCVLQWAEIRSNLGPWIAEAKPEFGVAIAASFDLTVLLDRSRIAAAARRRETLFHRLQAFLGPNDLLCMPTAPTLAPLKGQLLPRTSGSGYYSRALAMTSVAGIGRLPQVSLPLGSADGVPVGLSLLAGNGRDPFLLSLVRDLGIG